MLNLIKLIISLIFSLIFSLIPIAIIVGPVILAVIWLKKNSKAGEEDDEEPVDFVDTLIEKLNRLLKQSDTSVQPALTAQDNKTIQPVLTTQINAPVQPVVTAQEEITVQPVVTAQENIMVQPVVAAQTNTSVQPAITAQTKAPVGIQAEQDNKNTWTLRVTDNEKEIYEQTVLESELYHAMSDISMGREEFLVLTAPKPVNGITFVQICKEKDSVYYHTEAGTTEKDSRDRPKILCKDKMMTREAMDVCIAYFLGQELSLSTWYELQ